ncbi:MAG: ABC transporter ATP-binding protein [Fidelibacterota bacterium]|nr:MAG: ABC transporter ATP-binding protein [Candidatus Neomarinimicrobiota bacterium]
MSTVVLKDVHKDYGKVKAVRGISFECADREILAILGPSGAGKTSTLKMIAGLESITMGEIFENGRLVNFLPPEKRNTAMVFESYALYPHLSVYDNIAFPLRSRSVQLKGESIDARVLEVADMLQIGPLLGRKPAELSGGQKQRVALGRALAKRAEVLLLDEPISHLDAKLRHHMRRELKKYQQALNTTVIYVTHDYLEALALASTIVVLNMGVIHQTGSPGVVYNRPADTFVATLIGQPRINLVPCRIQNTSAPELECISGDGSFRVPCPLPADQLPSGCREVLVGIRPQFLQLTPNLDDDGIAGEIYVSEYMGTDSIVEVKVGDHLLKVLTKEHGYRIAQAVKLQVLKKDIMLFDAQTGKNLLNHREPDASHGS